MTQTIDDLFFVKYGQRELHSKGHLTPGGTVVIASQSTNNGCYGFFDLPAKYQPPFITVQSTGSIGEAFVQEFPCAVNDDVLILQPKKPMEIERLYFVAAFIRQHKWRYNYGRKITPHRLRTLEIDFSKMNLDNIKAFRQDMLDEVAKINGNLCAKHNNYKRGKTTIGRLFHIAYGQHELHSKAKLKPGNNLVISSQGEDNGCYGFYDTPVEYATYVISIPATGSIGMAFVQEHPCSIDDNCLVLSVKDGVHVSVEEMYFVASVIRLNAWRFRYGRQVTAKRISDLEVDFTKFSYDKTKALKERIDQVFH
jgi:hypothetical protein